MSKKSAIFFIFMLSGSVYAGDRQVLNSVSFESGKIQPVGEFVDAGYISTLPDPQSGSEAIQTGSGGCGENSNCDLRVVQRESVDGQTVTARAGKYFMRIVLDKDKDYTRLNSGKQKPRNGLRFRNDVYRFDHDVEEWIGFSVFLPNGYEDETDSAGLVLLEITTDSSAQFIKLLVGMRSGDSTSHWYVKVHDSDTSVTNGRESVYDLGSIKPDKGQWTDFVLRIRANPFSKDTNPAAAGISNAKDKTYRANKGILQVWKAEGRVDAAGNRTMINKIDRVNEPVGLVPGVTQGKDKIGFGPRAYKGGWLGNNGRSSSVEGPIWIAWDEVRFGEAVRHGTGYEDVHPTGLACESRCPDGSGSSKDASTRPLPPSGLVVLE